MAGSAYDPAAFLRAVAAVADRAQPLVAALTQKLAATAAKPDRQATDYLDLAAAQARFFGLLWSEPARVADLQANYLESFAAIWRDSVAGLAAPDRPEPPEPNPHDRRFRDPSWTHDPVFARIKDSYLMTCAWVEQSIRDMPALDDEARARLLFGTREMLNALSPSNVPFANPAVLRETIRRNGENLIDGLRNLVDDFDIGQARPFIRTVPKDGFTVGVDLAATPGKVVFENTLFQLIQYSPVTETVSAVPLLIVPPWINKYYILDLQGESSLVRWLVAQGQTVFMLSWANPDSIAQGQMGFEDYMQDGVLAALSQVLERTGQDQCSMVGYCLGGTLLAATLAWMEAEGRGGQVASASFLTTLIDFTHAGELKLFMTEQALEAIEHRLRQQGYLEADAFRQTFALLRSNDMIWSFVVNNYYLGRSPDPFDLLHWNDDATNMPAEMQRFIMRSLYRDNALAGVERLTLCGRSIAMGAITRPAYFLSAQDDHIAPWQASYDGARLFSGPTIFTLAGSGHVAGIVNPPARGKYMHFTSDALPDTPDAWLEQATRVPGSWWPHWLEWLKSHAGAQVTARDPEADGPAIEDAPGRYVQRRG